ncbi:MAG: hypothetical protein OXR66_01775 [Candidatus Woesearchaeota archaeon]|nr:hypothetical protein [Candidatus Woesearchaeota archaeon]
MESPTIEDIVKQLSKSPPPRNEEYRAAYTPLRPATPNQELTEVEIYLKIAQTQTENPEYAEGVAAAYVNAHAFVQDVAAQNRLTAEDIHKGSIGCVEVEIERVRNLLARNVARYNNLFEEQPSDATKTAVLRMFTNEDGIGRRVWNSSLLPHYQERVAQRIRRQFASYEESLTLREELVERLRQADYLFPIKAPPSGDILPFR